MGICVKYVFCLDFCMQAKKRGKDSWAKEAAVAEAILAGGQLKDHCIVGFAWVSTWALPLRKTLMQLIAGLSLIPIGQSNRKHEVKTQMGLIALTDLCVLHMNRFMKTAQGILLQVPIF
jgi:hypothetical protein